MSYVGWDAWPELTSVQCASPGLAKMMLVTPSFRQSTSVGGEVESSKPAPLTTCGRTARES